MNAVFMCNDASLDKKIEEMTEASFNNCHTEILALIKETISSLEAKSMKEGNQRRLVTDVVTRVLAAVNETRLGLNKTRTSLNMVSADMLQL